MHILCTICSDIVNQAESIFATKCGHLFHHQCLAQWIERSKTCPQCRNKVTDKCMYRVYPTAPESVGAEDADTLQSRLDDAMLQLRQNKKASEDAQAQLAATVASLKKSEELVKSHEKKLVTRESAIAALKEQLDYVKIQNKETNKLREENEVLRKNLQTLQALQKVLNASGEEVESMLAGYSDVRTLATFATALKKALCESESKKNSSRESLQQLKNQLATERGKVAELQDSLRQLREQEIIDHHNSSSESRSNKRKSDQLERAFSEASADSPSGGKLPRTDADVSVGSLVRRIESSDSPYLQLRLGLAAPRLHRQHYQPLQTNKPVTTLKLSSSINSITNQPHPKHVVPMSTSIFSARGAPPAPPPAPRDVTYDGLGGHSRPDSFPVPRGSRTTPKLSAKHRLRRPPAPPAPPADNRDIAEMFNITRNT